VTKRASGVSSALLSQIIMDGVDIDDLQGDIAPAECLTNWGDGCGMVLLQKKQAVSQAKSRSTGPGLFGEARIPP
jgi:hypothetical protein